MRRALLTTLAFLTAAVAEPRHASAAGPTMSECLSANESAITLRRAHKLRRARDQSLFCAAPSCPGEVRDVCQKRATELVSAIPTLVFLAKDRAGHDIVAVRVSMDGELLGDHLDGTPLPVEPGQHTFTFEIAGQPPAEQSFVVSEGQKDRRETITLGPETMAAPTAPTPDLSPSAPGSGESIPPGPHETAQRSAGLIVGAVGIVGIGVGAVAGGIAASDWSSANAACKGQTVTCTTNPDSPGFKEESSATRMATISTVGFIAGGALAAGGLALFLTAPRSTSTHEPGSARGLEIVPAAGAGGPGATILGWF